MTTELRIGRNDDGTLDEAVLHISRNVWFHIEQMDDGCWFINGCDGKTELHGFLHTKRGAAIHANVEDWPHKKLPALKEKK